MDPTVPENVEKFLEDSELAVKYQSYMTILGFL